MPIYRQIGLVPHKRHVVFRQPNGDLYHEELIGTEGFSGVATLAYHLYPPTMVKDHGKPYSMKPEIAIEDNLQARSFQGFHLQPEEDYLKSRKVLFVNDDLTIGLAAPSKSMEHYFFKNADADELIFIHEGEGTVNTMFGSIDFEYGDYIVIPRGTVYQVHFTSSKNKWLIVESFSPVETPPRYRNQYGQFLENSPFCERDFKLPQNLKTHELGR
jgi:homogentisate 1,2-dioxygenase